MIKLDKHYANIVEEGISPPMRHATTIPVEVDGYDAVIYVCTSPFKLHPKSGDASRSVVRKVAEALTADSDTALRAENEVLRTALGHAWHNERTAHFTYDEWAVLVERLLGPKMPGTCDYQDVDRARQSLVRHDEGCICHRCTSKPRVHQMPRPKDDDDIF